MPIRGERLSLSKEKFGATHTVQAVLNPNGPGGTDVKGVQQKVLAIVGEEMEGVDVVIEAVGLPGGFPFLNRAQWGATR